jgi:hypothetical protein
VEREGKPEPRAKEERAVFFSGAEVRVRVDDVSADGTVERWTFRKPPKDGKADADLPLALLGDTAGGAPVAVRFLQTGKHGLFPLAKSSARTWRKAARRRCAESACKSSRPNLPTWTSAPSAHTFFFARSEMPLRPFPALFLIVLG